MPDYIKFPLVLFLVTVISAFALGYVHRVAAPKIAKQKRKKEEKAEKSIFPGCRTAEKEVEGFKYREVLKGGKVAGYVKKGRAQGYSSTIEVLVGMNADFSVQGVKVLSQNETPGLGTRIEEIKSDKTWLLILAGKKSLTGTGGEKEQAPWFLKRFRGLEPEEIRLSEYGGKVDAITGATVSSEAVTKAVREAAEKLKERLQGK